MQTHQVQGGPTLTLTGPQSPVHPQVEVSLVGRQRAVGHGLVAGPHREPHVGADGEALVDDVEDERAHRQPQTNGHEVVKVNVPFHLRK